MGEAIRDGLGPGRHSSGAVSRKDVGLHVGNYFLPSVKHNSLSVDCQEEPGQDFGIRTQLLHLKKGIFIRAIRNMSDDRPISPKHTHIYILYIHTYIYIYTVYIYVYIYCV